MAPKTSNGGGRRWTVEERHALHLLNTQWGLTREEVHDLFGRMYGATMVAQDRYKRPQGLRDEWTGRWKDGRSRDWLQIDTANLSAAMQQQRQQLIQRITTIAAQSGTNNAFTGNVDQPVALVAANQANGPQGAPNAPAPQANVAGPSAPSSAAAAMTVTNPNDPPTHAIPAAGTGNIDLAQDEFSFLHTMRDCVVDENGGLQVNAMPQILDDPNDAVHMGMVSQDQGGEEAVEMEQCETALCKPDECEVCQALGYGEQVKAAFRAAWETAVEEYKELMA